VRDFLEVLDELNHLGIEFASLRESIDTSGPLGRAIVVIVGAISELERSLTQVARKHRISRASVCRLVKETDARQDQPVRIRHYCEADEQAAA
jgi:hypothetical protein